MEKQPEYITEGEVMQCYSEVERGGEINQFSIVYCKPNGEERNYPCLVKGGGKKAGNQPSSAINYSLKEYGLIKVKDFSNGSEGRQFDLAMRRIMFFNGRRVWH